MSLVVNDDSKDNSGIKVYGDVKPKAEIDCRTCIHAGMSNCHLQLVQCVRGSQYAQAAPVQFWMAVWARP